MSIGEGIELELMEASVVTDEIVVSTNTTSTTGNRRMLDGESAVAKAQPHAGAVEKHNPTASRYFFTDPPVEKYYYHQPIVKKVQPTSKIEINNYL